MPTNKGCLQHLAETLIFNILGLYLLQYFNEVHSSLRCTTCLKVQERDGTGTNSCTGTGDPGLEDGQALQIVQSILRSEKDVAIVVQDAEAEVLPQIQRRELAELEELAALGGVPILHAPLFPNTTDRAHNPSNRNFPASR